MSEEILINVTPVETRVAVSTGVPFPRISAAISSCGLKTIRP